MIHRLIYTSIGPVVGRALVIVDLRVAAYICGGVFSVSLLQKVFLGVAGKLL